MTRFQRWLLYSSTAVAATSGLVYFWMKRFLTPTDPWAVINHPLEPWALKLHILSAPVMLFAVGLITTQHIWRSLRSSLPTGRRSGIIATMGFVPLVVTGYLIQVVTSPLALEILAWTHLSLGLAFAWALASHRRVLKPRRLKRRRGSLPVLEGDSGAGGSEPGVPQRENPEVGGSEPRVPEPENPEPVGPEAVSPESVAADASPSASGTRGRRSESCRPRTGLREESSSTASS